MLTICWAAKGGSGTTVFAAAKAITSESATLLIDLAGDVPAVLGVPDPDGPGIREWLGSDAPTDRLVRLETPVTTRLDVIHTGVTRTEPGSDASRWFELAAHLRAEAREVIVDAGTGPPPTALAAAADESILVTRACYLALRRLASLEVEPTGIALVEEPGRALTAADVEASVGAPVVSRSLLDPAIARAVDAGLLVSRLPGAWQRQLRRVA